MEVLTALPTPKVGVSVSEPENVKSIGTNSVYEGIDPNTNEVKYVGITERKPEVRWNEHLNSATPRADLEYRTVITGLNRIDARVYEQNLINRYGLNNLFNVRNSISPKFWNQYNIKY